MAMRGDQAHDSQPGQGEHHTRRLRHGGGGAQGQIVHREVFRRVDAELTDVGRGVVEGEALRPGELGQVDEGPDVDGEGVRRGVVRQEEVDLADLRAACRSVPTSEDLQLEEVAGGELLGEAVAMGHRQVTVGRVRDLERDGRRARGEVDARRRCRTRDAIIPRAPRGRAGDGGELMVVIVEERGWSGRGGVIDVRIGPAAPGMVGRSRRSC